MAGPQAKLVHKQFNSPIGLYSDANVREVLDRDTKLLSNGAVGIDFQNSMYSKPANLQNSAVLRMLEEQEQGHRITGVKRVAWPPPREGEDYSEEAPTQAQGGPQYSSQSAPGFQNNHAPKQSISPNYQQAPQSPNYQPVSAVSYQQGSPSPNQQKPISPLPNSNPPSFSPTGPAKGCGSVNSPVTAGAPPHFKSVQPPQTYQQLQQHHNQQPQNQFQQSPHQQQYQQPQQQPQNQYQPPSNQYQQPPNQYQQAPNQYQQPQNQYQEPQNQYQQPQNQYQQPQNQYQPPQNQYQQPQNQYQPQQNQYQQPQNYYQQPQNQFQQPQNQYQQPQNQYQQPQNQYQQPQQQYQSPQPQYQPQQQYQQSHPQQNFQPQAPFQEPQYQHQHQQPVQTPVPLQQTVQTTPSQVPQQNYHQQQYKPQVEPPPSIITLRPAAPVSQRPAPVYSSQPATATFKGGKHLRGDLKWPPPHVRTLMEQEQCHLEEIARGPAIRPSKNLKDYSPFFAQHQINSTYPGYKIPPGTQFYDHEPVM